MPHGSTVTKVFISYRRESRADYPAVTLHDKLEARFGPKSVFLDSHGIPGGVEFDQVLRRQIEACRVMLVLVHEGWADIRRPDGTKRLDHADDWVRQEIELAMELEKNILPVLVGESAKMPSAEEVPASLSSLPRIHALRLRAGADQANDVSAIGAALEALGVPPHSTGSRLSRPRMFALAMALALAVGAVLWALAPARSDTVMVPAGPFLMGCDQSVDGECTEDELKAHPVDVLAFRIDRTETTVAQYAQCVHAGACTADGLTVPFERQEQPEQSRFCNWDVADRQTHPINCLSWEQARAYCAWAGGRLPTEAEWEKAARGEHGRKYPWGNEGYAALDHAVANVADMAAQRADPEDAAPGFATAYDDGYEGTAPADAFPAGASPYGALNMVGNVWEWVDGGSTERRIVRGGSFFDPTDLSHASSRLQIDANSRPFMVGLRCAH